VFEQLQAKLNEGVAKIGEGVESVGNAVVRLGRWMRSQLTGEEYIADEGKGSKGGLNKAAGVVAAVTVAMVAIVAVVVLRMPPHARRNLLARVFKRG
jgi:hypothetical protein